jgi:hypothetical protein
MPIQRQRFRQPSHVHVGWSILQARFAYVRTTLPCQAPHYFIATSAACSMQYLAHQDLPTGGRNYTNLTSNLSREAEAPSHTLGKPC